MFSLPDWAFYPLAALLPAGMIAGALSAGENSVRSPEEILAEGVLFEGDSLNAIVVGNGLTAQVLTADTQTFVRIDAVRGPFDGIQSAGAFFTLSPEELEAMQGRRVRAIFTVRAAETFGATGTRINLFLPGFGQTAWQRELIGEDFQTLTLEINPTGCEWDFGFIGIWPDWVFERNTVDVARVELAALDVIEGC